jgi:hypothetical protein
MVFKCGNIGILKMGSDDTDKKSTNEWQGNVINGVEK